MIIEEALLAYLEGDNGVKAISTRGYPNAVPQDAQLPAWAYQRIDGPRVKSHDGPSGLAHPRFQITCESERYGTSKALANAIRTALDGYKGVMGGVNVHAAFVEDDRDGFESQAAQRHVVRLDVIIWHEE